MQVNTTSPRVSIGVDAAVVAPHQIAVRGEVRDDFRVSPTLAGLATLTERLTPLAVALVVAEPIAGTWLPLAHAVIDAGCETGFVTNRDLARLRKAIVGASKTDVIDADMLAQRDHNHISANTAITRKLACRAWAIATTGRPINPAIWSQGHDRVSGTHRSRFLRSGAVGSTCAILRPMDSVGLRELRQDASELVRRVESGEHIDITVAGRLAARMVPVTAKRWQTWDAIADLFRGPPDLDWQRDHDLLDQSIRNPWDKA